MGKRENTKIVVDGFNEGKSDNDILQELFKAGVEFDDLRPKFNAVLKDKGLRLTNKERKIKTNELLDGVTGFESAEDMLSCVAMLQEKLKVATTKAMGSLRTFAKENGFELPKTPKVAKDKKVGFGGHYGKILDYAMGLKESGSEITKEDAIKFCHDNEIPEAYSTMSMNIVHFAKRWSGEIVTEATDEVEEQSEAA